MEPGTWYWCDLQCKFNKDFRVSNIVEKLYIEIQASATAIGEMVRKQRKQRSNRLYAEWDTLCKQLWFLVGKYAA